MEGKRSQKKSHNKENNCVQETTKPEVVSGCIGCRKQRLANEGMVQKLWKKFYMALTMCKLYVIKYHITSLNLVDITFCGIKLLFSQGLLIIFTLIQSHEKNQF